MKLTNKIAVITGGSSGIGQAIAQKFIQEGAKTIVFDLQKPKFKTEFFKVDITQESEIKKALNKFDKLDILINNAGIYFDKFIEETKKEDLNKIFDINFNGTFLMCKHALPLIVKSQGNIINIASTLGMIPEPEAPAYCATKAAVIMLTKCLSQTYALKDVRINAVLPGPIDTPLLNSIFKTKKKMEEYFANKPFGRLGKPEEVANVVAFLASEEASYVTGATWTVDGGEAASSLYTEKRNIK